MNVDVVLVAAIAAVGGIIGGTGGAEAIKAVTGRRPKKAIAVDNDVRLAQQAAAQAAQSAAYAAQMQEAARAAWSQARAAEERTALVSRQHEERADKLERQADRVQVSLDLCSRYVVWLLGLIREPGMEMPVLREHVSRHKPPVGVGEQ